MATIKNIELIDDIRTDALILMKNDPKLNYEDAFELAKKNLIGDEKISSFEFQPFNVEVDEELISRKEDEPTINEVKEETSIKEEKEETISIDEIDESNLDEEQKKDLELLKKLEPLDIDYYGNIRNQLKDIIDVNKFNNDQIEQLYIGKKMGVDITKIYNNNLSAQQIKFLCVMLATGKDISDYVLDSNFDVEEAFASMVEED